MQYISGLSSGIDWRNMIDQMIAVDHQVVDNLTTQRSGLESKQKAWQEINTKLSALKSAAEKLRDLDNFSVFTTALSSNSSTDAEDILSAAVGSGASLGTFDVVVSQTATYEKLSSNSFDSVSDALGLSGEFLLGGQRINIAASDSLAAIRTKIENANSGDTPSSVSASIMTTSEGQYRLVLTSDDSGADGIDIRDSSATDLVQALGFTDSSTSIREATSSGALSVSFSSSDTAVSSLLNLTAAPTGTVTIGAYGGISLDLSKSLEQIKDDINAAAGASIASIVQEEGDDGDTTYQLKLVGTSYADDGNVLESLGILSGGHGSVQEVHQSDALSKSTAAGGGVIDAFTSFSQIDTGSGLNNIANGDTITLSGVDHSGNTFSDTFTITNAAGTTVGDLLTEIESLFAGAGSSVTASVDASGKITVTDDTGGDSQLSLNLVANNEGGGTLDFGEIEAVTDGRAMQVQAGRNAVLTVDGVRLERESNSVDDAIAGVTLNLAKADSSTVTVSIDRDKSEITGMANSFVKGYNSVASWIREQTKYDEETESTGGPLFGDSTLTNVQTQLLNLVINTVDGASSSLNTLAAAGISLQEDGQLELDSTKFQGYIDTDFQNLTRLFAAQGSGSIGSIEYMSYSRDTKAGAYDVNITQVAEQASATGSVDLSSGIAGAETLTLTDKVTGQVAVVEIESGWTTDAIVNAINSEMARNYTHVLTEGGAGNTIVGGGSITSSTKLNLIDTTGGGNDLSNGDRITFSGTKRNGIEVQGFFEITDVADQTVGDLLENIEQILGDEVDATIDTSGHIVITDKTSGMSQISLNLGYVGDGSLSLGSVDTSTTGRYAIDITAENDGSGHVTLRHDDYGSAAGYTVASANGFLGITSQEYVGQDVAGTINGELATGSGQVLSGNSGSNNIDGLVMKYTGTATGNVGTLSMTLGFGEDLERILYGFTDPYSGLIDAKNEGYDSSIDSINEQIDRMESRLQLRRQTLVNQFLAMEKMMNTLQSQGSWLSAQLSNM